MHTSALYLVMDSRIEAVRIESVECVQTFVGSVVFLNVKNIKLINLSSLLFIFYRDESHEKGLVLEVGYTNSNSRNSIRTI